MRLKKLGAVLLVLSMTTGLMAGCGSGGDQGSTGAGAGAGTEEAGAVDTGADAGAADAGIEPCTIEFWHAMTGVQEATLTTLTEKFNSENEYGITVTLVNQGYYSDLKTKLTANAAAGTLPDMAQAYNSYLPEYIDSVVALDDFVANDFDDWNDIVESYRNEVSEFGFISGIPFNKSTYVYFYNKTLFDELGLQAPANWDDLANIGETFKSEKDMVAVGWDDLAGMFEAAILANGGEYISEDGALFDNEIGLATTTAMMDLFANGYARLVGEDGFFSGPFGNQRIASYVGSSTGVSYIDTAASGTEFELGVAPLPGGTAGQAANAAGTNLVMFAQDANQQKATWEYMKYLVSVESTTEWAIATGYLPVRMSAYESDTYQAFMANDPTAQASYAQAPYFFNSAGFEGADAIRTNMSAKIEEMVLDGADAETTLSALVDVVNKELK